MRWNRLKSWLSSSPRKSAGASQHRAFVHLEGLETRITPAFTVGPNVNITQSNSDDAENTIAINPTNPLNLFAASTGGSAHRYSLDGGLTWQNSDLSAVDGGVSGGDDQAAWDEFGNLFMTYFGSANTLVSISTDGGATFQLALDTGSFFDQPSIAVGAGSVWVCYDEGTNQAIRGAAVTGLGQVGAWSAEQIAPGTTGQFGDIAIGPNGEVFIVYQESGTGEATALIFGNLDPDGLGPAGFDPQITITSSNVGFFDFITPQPNRSIDAEANLAWDRTGGPNDGRLYMVYTDEVVDENNDTEIFVIFSDDLGSTWSSPVRVHDDAPGNGLAQMLPDIAVDQTTGFVAVAWYDCRNDPANQRVEAFATVSTDGGLSFEANQVLSQGSSITPGGGFDFGDFMTMDFTNGVFAYVWGDNSNSTGDNPAGVDGALDMYTALCIVTGGGGGGGDDFFFTPSPSFENEFTTLSGSFVDSKGGLGTHKLVIDWGDGSTQTINLPVGVSSFSVPHRYLDDLENSGIPVTVAITSPSGFKLEGTATAQVLNLDPTESTILGAPSGTINEGQKIILGASISDPSPLDSFEQSKWTVRRNGVVVADGGGTGFTFTPPDQGIYEVSFTAIDDDGGKLDASPVTLVVQNVAPTATQLVNDGAKKSGQTVAISFQGVSDAQGDLATLRYDFDLDGNGTYETLNKTSSQITTTFALEGVYTVKGRIRDKDGGISEDYFTDVVISDTTGGHGGFITTRFVVAGSDASVNVGFLPTSMVKVFGLDGTPVRTLAPLGTAYTGGYRVATGDVNGDKTEDIIIAPGINGGRNVFVYNGVDGKLLYSVTAPYATNFTRGIYVASGDFNRDGFDDFVIGPGVGQPGAVVGYNGQTQAPLFTISPFGASSKVGATVAVADVNGDKKPDLVVGNASVGSQVKVYAYTTKLATSPFWSFNAMPTTHNGGVFVAAGDVNGDRKADIIVGSNRSLSANSLVRVWDGATKSLSRSFVAYSGYKLGIRVAVDDLDGDGKADILFTPANYSVSVGLTQRIIGIKGNTLAGKFNQPLPENAFMGGVFVG